MRDDYDYVYDLVWYKTAGIAILAYHDKKPCKEALQAVNSLKAYGDIKDPPEDDHTMEKLLKYGCPESLH